LLRFYTLAICVFDMFHDGRMRLICLRAIRCWICAYRLLMRRSTTMELTKFEDEMRSKIDVCGNVATLRFLAAGVAIAAAAILSAGHPIATRQEQHHSTRPPAS
jgi:hypothetical protein